MESTQSFRSKAVISPFVVKFRVTTRRRTMGKIKSMAKKMTSALLPKAKRKSFRFVASARVISDRTTKGRARNIPKSGVNINQKAHLFQTHQYQMVAVGLTRMHKLQSSFWVQVALGVLAACTRAQIQKPIKTPREIPIRMYQVRVMGSNGELGNLRSGKFMTRIRISEKRLLD